MVTLRRSVEPSIVVRRNIPLRLAYPELIRTTVRVNPPARHAQTRVYMNTVCDPLRIKRGIVYSQNLRLKSGLALNEVLCLDRFGPIATVKTADVATLRHAQRPANTTVGKKSTDTVAVAGKSDGKSHTTRQHHLSKVTLAPQCSHVAVARHPKHRS